MSLEDYERRFYSNVNNKLTFPKTCKAYLESSCHESGTLPTKTKITDLGYMVTHGFDLCDYVKKYAEDRPQNKCFILGAFTEYISYMRSNGKETYGAWMVLYNELIYDDLLNIEQWVSLFCKEVSLRFYIHSYTDFHKLPNLGYDSNYEGGLKDLPDWNYDEVMGLHLSKERLLEIILLPTDEYLETISKIKENGGKQ